MPKFTDGNGDKKFIYGKGRKRDLDLSTYDDPASQRHDAAVNKVLSKHEEDPSKDEEKRKAEEARRAVLAELERKRMKAAKTAKSLAKKEQLARTKRMVALAKKDSKKVQEAG